MSYEVKPYLESGDMAEAYAGASLAVARSGGALAEFALFGLPSVLVPLPGAPGDHQLHNAEEFVEMGAATLHPQTTSTPERLAADIRGWLENSRRLADARQSVRSFDIADATER